MSNKKTNMKTITRTELMPGEEVIHSAPMHWKTYILPSVVIMLAAIILLLVTQAATSMAAKAAACTVIAMLAAAAVTRLLHVRSVQYLVTNRRVIRISGAFRKKVSNVNISDSLQVIMSQTPEQYAFATATLHIQAADAVLVLGNVQNPIRFRLKVMEQTTGGLFNADSYTDHLKSGN